MKHYKKSTLSSLIAICISACGTVMADKHEYDCAFEKGSFNNPVIWADVPDPDVIRVGEDFYMVSTTMHLMPGCPVMHSRDLVNWETIGYVFDKIEDSQRYSLEGGTVYGKGQWATSIRYRDGRYYVLFSPNDEPYKSYIYTAENPAGPWQLICRSRHFHDASLLLDDDGKAYVFYGSGDIKLCRLNDDLNGVMEGGIDKTVIVPGEDIKGLHEGSRAFKHNGKYYVFVISWPSGQPRRQLCYRADRIEGPYERCVVLQSEFGGFPYVGQGCLVDDTENYWWGMIFQDRGGVGRVLTLNQCTWRDGWPMLGDSKGKVPASVVKTLEKGKTLKVVESDEFNDGQKSILWQWNHNPDDTSWSLTDRNGWLTLSTCKVVENLFEAPNTITQRMTGPYCQGEVKLDVKDMKNGDRCGFAAFNGDTGLVGVEMDNDRKYIVTRSLSVRIGGDNHGVTDVEDTEIERIPLQGDTVYFKINADFMPGSDMAEFSYSIDGEHWTVIGNPFKMRFDYTRLFMGTRYAIYNYATQSTGGKLHVDWFRQTTIDNKD